MARNGARFSPGRRRSCSAVRALTCVSRDECAAPRCRRRFLSGSAAALSFLSPVWGNPIAHAQQVQDAKFNAQQVRQMARHLRELARTFGGQTILGGLLALGAYLISGSLVIWMSAVIAGLLLAIPTAALTSSSRLGSAFRSGGLLLTAEEKSVLAVLLRARSLSVENSSNDRSADPVTVLAGDRRLLNLLLEANAHGTPRRRGQVDEQLAIALARLDDAESRSEALSWMSQQALFAILASPTPL